MKCMRTALPSLLLGVAVVLAATTALHAQVNNPLMEDFDTPNPLPDSTNTPVTLEFFNSDPGLDFGVIPFDGNPGGMFQVTSDGVNDNRNYAYFDRTAEGAYEAINFSFDLKIGPQDASADGGSISFISTDIFGTSGGVAVSAFGVPEDPAQIGVLGIGFDTWSNTDVGDLGPVTGGSNSLYNDVTLYWNGSAVDQFVNPDATMRDVLPNGVRIDDNEWHTVQGSVSFANQTASMTMTDASGTPQTVWENVSVPGLVPFESRVMFGARTGGENENFQVDNLSVEYVNSTADGFGPADPQAAPNEGFWSVREWNVFPDQINGTAGADMIIADPNFQKKIFISDGMSETINFADPQNAGGGFSIPIGKQPFFSDTSGDDNDVVMRAIAKVIIPSDGDYTFGIDGDDGTRLTLQGANFTMQAGGGNASGEVLEFPDNTGNAFTLASTFMAAGEYDIEVVWQERGGGAFVEAFAAPGVKSALDNDFAPIGQREEIQVASGMIPTAAEWNVRNVDVLNNLNNLADAQAAIDLDPSDPNFEFAADVTTDVINYVDPDTNASAGRFVAGGSPDNPDDIFPVDLPGNDDNDFATMATTIVTIAEDGDYLFGFGSDDGAAFTLEGADFTILNPGGARAVTNNGQTMEFNANTGNSDTYGTTFLAAGDYNATFLTWERGGGAWAEVFTGVGSIPESILSARLLGSPAEMIDIVIPMGLQLGGEAIVGGQDGDLDNDGFVGQSDIDLVLLNWGSDTVPAEWVNEIPSGIVGQASLDSVLLNWGEGSQGVGPGAVPEPSTIVMLLIAAGLGLGLIRRKR